MSIRRLPPLNPLKAFEAAARHMSLSAAATELHVTPAAVSRQVKLLEEICGVPLFERHHRAVRLTEAGQRYHQDIAPAFDAISQATIRLKARRSRGMLSIQSYTTVALRWLIPRLPAFRESHPEIEVNISASIKRVSFETDPIAGAIQVGSGQWRGLNVTRLFNVRLVPVCSPALRDSMRDAISPDNLSRTVLLHSLARKNDWGMWLEAAGSNGVDGMQGMRFENSSMAYQAAIEGIGVAIAQFDFVQEDIASGRLVMPFDFIAELDEAYYFVAPRVAVEDPNVALFRNWLKSCTGAVIEA